MKLSLIIVLVLKLVSCAIIHSENANLKNAGENLFNLNGSNVNTTLELPKTKYEDKRNYFCSACLNKALCKEKEKCYMCIKHCKNFKGQEYPKFKTATEANFQPDEKIIFNTNTDTPSTEFTFDSTVKNSIFAELINRIVKSTLSKFSTISNKTFVPANFQQWNLQTKNNSIQTDDTAINNNLIQSNNKNNENDIDIQGLPNNPRRNESSTNLNVYQQKVKRDLRASEFNRTQITEEKFNSARPYGGPFRKLNFSDTNKNKPMSINNEEEERREETLNPIQNQPFKRMQTTANTRENILPINESEKQIPDMTNRNLVPQFDVNQNRRIFKTEQYGINSEPFAVSESVDPILTSPLLFPNNEVQACNENLGDASSVDGKTFSLLQNLEKKIENIADLIKRGCTYNDVLKSENPENLNGLRLNKMKSPNDIFGKARNKINTQKANLFPNRIMEIPALQSNNEDGSESQNPISTNDDKILRDINPELFSENDDDNSVQLATDNLNNEDELANNENKPDAIKNNDTPIPFRNQFRLRKNPLQNDQNKPSITDLIKQRIEKIKPNLHNRFANSHKNDEQIPENNENAFEPEEEQPEENPEETFEPGVPWNNNKERSQPNLLPRSKPHIPKMKEALQRNAIKDRLKNNALPLQPRDNFKPAFSHLNNFISKLNDAPFQKLPKTNPLWNKITNPDITKPHFPLNKLDAEKPGRIPFQRMNSKPENAIADEQPKTRPFLFPKDRPGKHPNLPLIHQRFGTQDDLDPSVPVGSSNTNFEQNPNTFLGHVVVPQQDGKNGVESLDDMENKKIFFEGTGVNLPLTIKKNPEGTYKVSLAVDNICSTCNEKSCNLNEGLVGSPNQENNKSPLKFKELNDNVQNLNLPKNKPQGEPNNKFNNVRESNNVNEEIPEIKPRLFDKENNFINRRRNNDGGELKQKPLLFPRLSQIAKRSPSLLFNSPLLKLGENFLDSGDSDDFKTLNEYISRDLKKHGNDLNTPGGKNGEKGAVHKRVALMKDMLTWMKNVAEENTA